jgi:hypothetical protein
VIHNKSKVDGLVKVTWFSLTIAYVVVVVITYFFAG